MTSVDYDEYRSYVRNASDDELYYESEDTFVQIGDDDGCIKYALCVEEQNRRKRNGK